jgi:cell fate regulator YaaT (PSP1 superfamily)
MKLIMAEYNLEGNHLTIYFKAAERVDFRELVKELNGYFKLRVELRQVGPRDEAKLVGGYGRCGRPLCCASFLSEFAPVSIKMAKQQNLPLNPMKIAGSCGRLLCCLAYEAEPSQKAQEKSIETAKVMAEEDIESLEEASLEEITETKETDKPNNIIENGTENQPPAG